jgi:hypothetical protein
LPFLFQLFLLEASLNRCTILTNLIFLLHSSTPLPGSILPLIFYYSYLSFEKDHFL